MIVLALPRLRVASLAAVALALAATPALAEDPALNESDMDDSVPPGDDSYLDDEYSDGSDPNATADDGTDNGTSEAPGNGDGSDPALGEDDFDATVPPADDDYLRDEYDLVDPRTGEDAADASPRAEDASGGEQVPGPSAGLLVAGSVGAAVALARRRTRA